MSSMEKTRSRKLNSFTQFLAVVIIPVLTVWIGKTCDKNLELRREESLRHSLAAQEKLAQSRLALDLLPHLADSPATQHELAQAVMKSAVPDFNPSGSRAGKSPQKPLPAVLAPEGRAVEFRQHLLQGNNLFYLGLYASADSEYLIAAQSLPHDAITLVDSHLIENARADYGKGLFPEAAKQFESAFHRVPAFK
jgi:hypothetical protein